MDLFWCSWRGRSGFTFVFSCVLFFNFAGSAHVSNSSCYSTCSGFHLLKISSIVTSASFYLAFTDQWFNPSPPPYFHYSSILGWMYTCMAMCFLYSFLFCLDSGKGQKNLCLFLVGCGHMPFILGWTLVGTLVGLFLFACRKAMFLYRSC